MSFQMYFLSLIAAGAGAAIGEAIWSWLKGEPWWPDSVMNGFLMGFAIELAHKIFSAVGGKD
jgi:hypothetical protein